MGIPVSQPRLLFKEKTWQAWDKPAGFSVHNESPSLLEFLQAQGHAGDLHFLNRLDKDTSGIVIIVTETGAVESLQKIWKSDSTRKIYAGLHRKRRRPPVTGPETWEESLSDRSEGRKNPRGLSADRVPCLTRMFPLEKDGHLELTALVLETGRQHQLRRHSVLHDMELVGDDRYGDRPYNLKLKSHRPDLRLGLHAHTLWWNPDGEPHTLVCPLPDFFLRSFTNAEEKVSAFVQTQILPSI